MIRHSSVAVPRRLFTVARIAPLAGIVGIWATVFVVSACGQKGPLTLPKGAGPSAPASAPSQ